VVVFDITLPSDSAYYLVYPEERADNPRITVFRDWLLREVAASAGDRGLMPTS
jgi:LysR family glycine cleavage system transcriptional activator